jgi:GntR family transcriptional regulator
MKAAVRRPIDLNRSAVARYIQLATLFRRRIESGVWVVGSQIPTVDDLAAECGVARMTIRQALDLLEADGLIDRYRAKGTFVKKSGVSELWCEVQTNWSGMLLSRDGATIEVLSVQKRAKLTSVSSEIGTIAPAYLHLHRRHWRDERPFMVADVYFEERVASKIPEKTYALKSAFRLLNDIPGLKIAAAHQTLTIGTADMELSHLLEVPLNAPVAHVQRRAIDEEGCVIFVSDGIYRGDVVRLDIKVR